MICGSGGSQSRLAEAAGAEPADQMKDEKQHVIMARQCAKHICESKCTRHLRVGQCTPVWGGAHLPVNMYETP